MPAPAALLAFALFQAQPVADEAQAAPRQAEVAVRAAAARPFDLPRTTRRFTPTPNGGAAALVSRDRSERRVSAVREHLRAQAAAFARGDYGASAGAELTSGASAITVAYADVARGGEIRFVTSDPALVRVLHAWLAAQR